MRIVLDTNVVVSALIWGGRPRELIQMAINGEVELCTCTGLLEELSEVLTREHLPSRIERIHGTVENAIIEYRALVVTVTPAVMTGAVTEDPDDEQVIATAVAAKADLIVSGDRHLLVVGSHRNIRIVAPAEAVTIIAEALS